MSCACEHKKLSSEYGRIRRLAKNCAVLNDETVVLYQRADGSYGFDGTENFENDNYKIIEYITPY